MNNSRFNAKDIVEKGRLALNLVMCDKKCKFQDDGYCMVKECKPGNSNETCPYYQEKKKGLAVEMPVNDPIEEVPSMLPDLPTTLPQQRLL